MAKKKKQEQSQDLTVAKYMNGSLDFVRDRCPNLVTVAASLLPFDDAFFRNGVAGPDEVIGKALIYDIAYPRLPEGVSMIATVSEECVHIRQVDDEDDEVLAVHVCSLPEFWEFLRGIPRAVGVFAQFVPPCDGECECDCSEE